MEFLCAQPDVEIPLVVSYELPLDKTYGYASVSGFCQENGLKVLLPKRISDGLIKSIAEILPDYIFSIYYRKILPKSIIKSATQFCINIHPSLLPEYRGPIPTYWAIKNGEKECGITIHKIDEGIDTGDIFCQKRFDIGDDETGFELYSRAMQIGSQLFKKEFHKIVNEKAKFIKQTGIGSYYGKSNGLHSIDWKNRSIDIRNMIRVHAKPYNPTQAVLLNRYFLINKARVLMDARYPAQGPGRIVDFTSDGNPIVSCADGCLILEEFEVAPSLTETERQIYLKIGNKFD
jgi:methionyl-tRNA formyltransferase